MKHHSKPFWRSIIFGAALSLSATALAQPARQPVPAHVPAAAHLAQPLGLMPPTQRLSAAIALPFRNQAALSNLLQQINNPASPNYRHYLTRKQFTERFGSTEQDYAALKKFAAASGLRINAEHANRMLLEVNGTVADIERVFHTTLRLYRHPTEARTFYAPDTEPSLDLAVPVLSVSGLDNYAMARPRLQSVSPATQPHATPNSGSGPGGTYIGNDFRAVYAPDTSMTGAGQVVGLLQFDGYDPADIAYYENQAGLPSVTLSNILLNGASGQPSGSGGEVEVSLDIETSISMAPGLNEVMVYEAPNPSPFEIVLNRMVSDDAAKQISCSWFIPGGSANPATDQIFQEMALQGQSFFNASGDNDAFTGLVDFPGDTPYITQVGGTTLSTTGPGGVRTSETVWNRGSGIGSGGGISTQYTIPSWQTNIDMSANQGSTTMRNVPDVALTADNVYVRVNGVTLRVGGTSCAAPLWAGFAALANQEAVASGRPTIGLINQLVDDIGSSPNYPSCFFDITTGDNTSSSSPTKFLATPGYDLCTGWGVPAGQSLIDALAQPESLQITPTTGFSSIGGVGGPFTINSQDLTLTNVGTNSLDWTLVNTTSWLDASPTSGTLNPESAPTIVTVSLNSTASNLTVGTYSATLWFTNLTSNTGIERDYSLSIISPPEVTTQPADQTVLDGATAIFSVEVTGGLPQFYQWQLNGTNLTDGGDFAGSTSTSLTVTNVSPADVGAYALVITNVAGTTVSSNALLSITDSEPVIITQPVDQTIVAGKTAAFTVAAIGSKPFYYQWIYGDPDGTNIDGATNATLVLPGVQLTDAGLYSVVVSNFLGATASSDALLKVVEVPIITAFNPASGAVGTNVTITGLNFSSTPANDIVYFGAVQAEVTSASPSNLVVGVPLGATFSPITVTVNGLTAFADQPFMPVFPGIGQIDSSSFAPPVNLDVPHGPIRVCIADLDGDGKPDLIVANSAAGVLSIFQNISTNGSLTAGSFGPRVDLFVGSAASGTDPYMLTTADLDGDGKLDIITLDADNNLVSIFRNIGSPGTITTNSFAARIDLPASNTMRGVAAQDLDGDGKPEIVTGNQDDGNISIFKNNSTIGNIAFAPRVNFTAGDGATTVAIADVDGDGKPDIAVANYFSGTVSIFKNLGLAGDITTNSFAPAVNFTAPATPFGLAFGDIDGDGKLDMVVGGEGGSQEIAVYRNTAAPGSITTNSFAPAVEFAAPGWVNFVALSDLDGDGKLDIALVTQPSSTFSVFRNISTPGSFTTNSLAPSVNFSTGSNPNGVSVGDLDGDGRPDVVFGNFYDNTISIYQNIIPIGAPPLITSQPTNLTVSVGNDASFSATVVTPITATYQWYGLFGILGATNSTLTLTNVQLAEAGNYYLVVSNLFGSVSSSNALLKVNPAACVPPASNQISWWAGETNTLDDWGANDGFVTNGAISYTSGKVNAAFHFDGGGAYIEIPATPSMNIGQGSGLTLEAWIQPADLVNQRPLFEWQSDGIRTGAHFWISTIGGAGCLYANIVDTNNNSHSIFSAPGILTSDYQHVALIYDKVTGLASIYRNGILVAQTNLGSFTPNTTGNLLLGERTGSDGSPQFNYTGDLDELSIYDRALSAGEIEAIYNASTAGKCIVPRPPSIVQQPTNQTARVGNTASFNVTAAGTAPLIYQWHFNVTNDIFGATNATLTLTDIQLTNAGPYTVTVTNVYDSVTSSNATLVVIPPPSGVPRIFSFNPARSSAGEDITLFGANFGSAISNNIVYFGAVQAEVTSASPTNLVVTVPLGATFSPITVTVNGLTAFADQPFMPVFPGIGQIDSSSFAPPVNLDVPHGPIRVCIADLDGDGKPDLIVANSAAGVLSIFQNISTNGSLTAGSFGPRVDLFVGSAASGTDPYMLTTADLDGDGKLDIITLDADNNLVSIFRNIGSPGTITTNSFAARIDLPASNTMRGVAAQDLDGDGKPEIVTGNQDDGNISIFKNNSTIGNIAFAPRVNFTAGDGATTVAIADVDGDGKPDIAVANYFSGTVSIFKNLGLAGDITTNSFAPAVNFTAPATPFGLAFGDIDGDGKLDMVVGGEGGSQEIAVYRNTAAPGSITTNSFAPAVEFAAPGWVNFVALSDLDGDGKLDIALVTQPSSTFSVFRNISTPGSFTTNSLAPSVNFSTGSNPNGVSVGDLDGDGRPDVVFGNFYDNTISIYQNIIPIGAPPLITSQPTNLTVSVGNNATFMIAAASTVPLTYQWYFDTSNNISAATNSSLTLTNVQLTNAGFYSATVTSQFGSSISSNATLTVTPLHHFAWDPIPSPRFPNVPFTVTIVAQDTTNGIFTNFTGTVMLSSTNGVTITPLVSSNFIDGAWSGTITVPHTVSSLVLQADDGFGHIGLANSIDIVNPPSLGTLNFGTSLLVSWPLSPSGFVLESSDSLLPGTWTPVPGSPLQFNGQNLQSVPLVGTNQFFRLRFSGP